MDQRRSRLNETFTNERTVHSWTRPSSHTRPVLVRHVGRGPYRDARSNTPHVQVGRYPRLSAPKRRFPRAVGRRETPEMTRMSGYRGVVWHGFVCLSTEVGPFGRDDVATGHEIAARFGIAYDDADKHPACVEDHALSYTCTRKRSQSFIIDPICTFSC